MTKNLQLGNIVKVNEQHKTIKTWLKTEDLCLNEEYTIMDIEEIGERFVRINKSYYWWHPDVFVLVRNF